MPRRFGHFELLSRLSRGGMAELFTARSLQAEHAGQLLVVKLIASRFAKDPDFIAMLRDEACIAATLNHPNIGRIHEIGDIAGRHYLAMEYLHGKDLRAVVERALATSRAGIPPALAAIIGARVCSALHHAHDACAADGTHLQVIHRDVSPSNIMITYDGAVKLIDFGIAKAANRSSLTVPGCIKGKARYLAPEQLLEEPLDRRTDLFTLANSIWEATVGRPLFSGTQDYEVFLAISDGKIERPSAVVPDYPRELEAVLLKALQREPPARYADALSMRRALEQFAARDGLPPDEADLAAYMRELFGDEVERWEMSKAAHLGLAEHILATAGAEALDLAGTSDPATIEPVTTEEVSRNRRERAGMQGAGGPENRSILDGMRGFAGGPATPQTGRAADLWTPLEAQAPARATVLFASPAPPPALGTPDRGAAAGEFDGGAKRTVLYGFADDGPASRRTRIAGSGPTGPVPIRPSGKPASDPMTGPVQPLSLRAFAPEPSPSHLTIPAPFASLAPESAPEPLVASDREELARLQAARLQAEQRGEREDPSEGASALVPRRKRRKSHPPTGDWAVQSAADERPGTHPYFRPGSLAEQALSLGGRLVPRKRRQKRAAALAATASLAIAGTLGTWALLARWDGDRRTAPAVEPSPAPPPGNASAAAIGEASVPTEHPIRLTSDPPGATAYSGIDGQELGKTPLALPPQQWRNAAIDLHLEGYDSVTVKFGPRGIDQHVSLRPTATPVSPRKGGSLTTRRADGPRHENGVRRPASTRKRRHRDKLVDPF